MGRPILLRPALVRTLLALPLLALPSGCYSPGGGLFASSDGQWVYPSTETMVKSITMIDLRTNEPFFAQVIPPGQQLTVQFLAGGGDDAVLRPDRMIYEVQPLGTGAGRLSNQLTVPPAASRRIDVEVNQSPAFRETPPNELYRTDDPASRPDYWSPAGGERPSTTGSKYDG